MNKSYIGFLLSNDSLRKCARFFHISSIVKKIYFYLFAPANKIVSLTINGITAIFHVKHYGNLIYLTKTIYRKEADEIEVISTLLNEVKAGDVCYDIGAFIGLHAIFLSKKAGDNGKVVSFEPYSLNRESLQENISLNNANNIVVADVALGDKSDIGIINGDDFSIHNKSYLKKGVLDEEIKIMQGDFVVEERNFPLPNVVKIDVDGFEYATIKGLEKTLKNPNCRFLSCEVHPFLLPAGITADMVVNLVKEFGFINIKTYNLGIVFHIFCSK